MPRATDTEDLEPKRLPLVVMPDNRDTTTNKDARLVNGYVEKDDLGQYQIYKRPGLAAHTTLAGGAGRGLYTWQGNIYAISGTTLYKNGASIGTVNATNGVYRFDSVLGATPKLVLGDGVKAYYWDETTLAQIADTDFPAAFRKGWAYLDGGSYVLLADAHIQGSDENNPSSWDALNSILAQVEPDQGVFLGKHLSYVLAWKQWSTEVFYDAGASPGSPLAAMQGAKIAYGCAHQDSPQSIDDTWLWLATNKGSSLCVVSLKQLKADVVSSRAVERLLSNTTVAGTIRSWYHKEGGHTFYGLTLVDLNLTLVYDLREGFWSQWTDSAGNYLPIVASTYSSDLKHLVQLEDGNIYDLGAENVVDASPSANSLITVDIYTPNTDFGNRWKKVMQGLNFVGDQTAGSVLQVRVSDDDYTSWSQFRLVELNQKKPALRNWGTFRRRAHHLRHACPTRFRIQAVEYDLLQGSI